MGEDDAEGEPDTPLPGHLAHLTWSSFGDYMVEEYDLPDNDVFYDLDELLTGIGMRDQQLSHPSFQFPKEQRKAVHRAAQTLVEEAHNARTAIHALRQTLRQFHAAVHDGHLSAVMLAETFDIDYVAPTALEPPPELDILWSLFHDNNEAFVIVERALFDTSNLPVKPKLRTNKVRNHAIEQALLSCRSYWIGIGRSWSRYTLAEAGVRHADERGNLTGPCERFVADMLTAHDIDFTLTSLNGAWSALDKRLRADGTAPPAQDRRQKQ